MTDPSPKRWIFDYTYLLRRPGVDGPIFSSENCVENIVEITFADYSRDELTIRNSYNIVDVVCFLDLSENEWCPIYKAKIYGLRVMDQRQFVVDDIDHVTAYCYYDDISRLWESGVQTVEGGRLKRLLWRSLDEINFISFRHWDRMYRLRDSGNKDWIRNGF